MAEERSAPRGVDLEKAMIDPGSVFASPEALLEAPGLSTAQKAEILRRWEYDAVEADVATEEGMPGEESDLLRRILLALERLGAVVDVERTAPTKQDGLPRAKREREP